MKRNWRDAIDDRLDDRLLDAVARIMPDVQSVQLDFANELVRVVSPASPDPQQRHAVAAAILNVLEEAYPAVAARVHAFREKQQAAADRRFAAFGEPADPARRAAAVRYPWETAFVRPHTYPFTLHVANRPDRLKPFEKTHLLVTYDVPITSLKSLHDAYDAVLHEARPYDYIAAFALGGTPALIHVSQGLLAERHHNQRPSDAAIRQVQERCHLFQGLNSAGGAAPQEAFVQWLKGISGPSSLFIFDTGSSGNGARQAFRLVRQSIRQASESFLRNVHVQAIVDREEAKQRRRRKRVVIGSNKGLRRWFACLLKYVPGAYVILEIDYLRVPRMLTEDCALLVGYDRNHDLGFIKPVKDIAVARLVNDDNDVLAVAGSLAAGPMFADVMSHPSRLAALASDKALDQEGVLTACAVLREAWRRESHDLSVAMRCGFFTVKEYGWYRRRLRRTFRAAIRFYPQVRWDFQAKRLVSQGRRRTLAE